MSDTIPAIGVGGLLPSRDESWSIHRKRYEIDLGANTIAGTHPWETGIRNPILAMPPDWTLASGCIDSDAHEAAFTHTGKLVADKAKAECATCPVREQCLELAMRMEEDTPARVRFGIAGGLTPRERFALFVQSGTQPHDTAENVSTAPPEALSA